MTQVKNLGLRNTSLNVGGTVIQSDENGVFEVVEEMADRLLRMPGFMRPRETVELRAAYKTFRVTEAKLAAAQAVHDVSKKAVVQAQTTCDRGGGTLVEKSDAIAALLPPAQPPEAPEGPPVPEDDPEDDPEDAVEGGSEGDPDEATRLRNRLGAPTMRWKLDDLLVYARGIGVEGADSTWTKAQIITEIEEVEAEGK